LGEGFEERAAEDGSKSDVEVEEEAAVKGIMSGLILS
jgi:hypothetical protein